ncbi:MAG: hypothetical protein CL868_02970 [Cytophagaceae bacterium]|nr:hypothetical protein [Cytophagaceae bacterium]
MSGTYRGIKKGYCRGNFSIEKNTTMKLLMKIVLLVLTTPLLAQEMEKGFDLLESQQYAEAKDYFADVLKQFPDNTTAQICYGRALGLGGDTASAKNYFAKILARNPQNLEVRLNQAESLLWNKDFAEALPIYEALTAQYPENFTAILGLANTQSNLFMYEQALETIHTALEVSPNNPNAVNSLKYIRLGYAYQLSKKDAYALAEQLLLQNLEMLPGDTDTLKNLVNLYTTSKQYDKVDETYAVLMQDEANTLEGLLGLVLNAHLQKRERDALRIATTVYEQRDTAQDILKPAIYERYVQALVWNARYAKAKSILEEFMRTFPEDDKVLTLRAMLGMYTGNFNQAESAYTALLAKDSTSFDGNLGIANAYYANGKKDAALKFAEQTLHYYPAQSDALNLIAKVNTAGSLTIKNTSGTTQDNGENKAYYTTFTGYFGIAKNLKAQLTYAYRTTENGITQEDADSQTLGGGLTYDVLPWMDIEASAGFVKASTVNGKYSGYSTTVQAKMKPMTRQDLTVGYTRELQAFNAALIGSKIFMNNYFVNHNIGITPKLGWYTSLIHTPQTDGNTRNILFTSVYYNLTRVPPLKMGLNYQYLGFKEQMPELYFSPESYQAVELFADVTHNTGNGFSYHALAAGGYQYVEQDDASTLYRLEASAGYNLKENFKASVHAKYSNIASATAAGFRFSEVGFSLQWQIR